MKNFRKKTLSKILSAFVVIGIIPTAAMAEEIQTNSDKTEIQGVSPSNQESVNITTSAAVVVKPLKTIDLVSEGEKVKQALSLFKASNETTEQDILNIAKDNVDISVVASFENIKIDKATTLVSGAISGNLIVKDDLGNSQLIKVNLIIEQLKAEINKNIITKLKPIMDGSVEIGQTITVNVIGYNALDEELKLDESKLTYEWLIDGRLVGTNKELKITEEFKNNKTVTCNVNYPDGEEGGLK